MLYRACNINNHDISLSLAVIEGGVHLRVVKYDPSTILVWLDPVFAYTPAVIRDIYTEMASEDTVG